jgi:hypothetical protein
MRWEGDEDKTTWLQDMCRLQDILRNKDRKYWKWMDSNRQPKMRLSGYMYMRFF